MYKEELKKQIHELFQEMKCKTNEMVSTSRTKSIASERIMDYVSTKVAAEGEGYIVDIYNGLVTELKSDEFFQNPEHLNAFYRLNLREELNQKYQFDVKSLKSYKDGIDYKEINRLYTDLGASAGTIALGGILKWTLASVATINLPIVVIIAGALLVGILTDKITQDNSKKDFIKAIDKYLNNMENEILDWLVVVETYFNDRIRSLYKM